MTDWSPEEMLSKAHAILARRYGELEQVRGQGITRGQRVVFHENGKRMRCLIKTSSGGRISFGRRDDGSWSGLSETDRVVVVGPSKPDNQESVVVSMFSQKNLMKIFEANYAATKKAGLVDPKGVVLPSWIAPFHEEGRGARGVGDGFGDEALWSEPLSPSFAAASAGEISREDEVRALSIAEAKMGLAKTFQVSPDAVEIIIRG
jgi:hypothetical protein